MNVYVSIVSHGHEDLILENKNILGVSKLPGVFLIIKDNLKSDSLRDFCRDNNIKYLVSDTVMGFGENNNFVFDNISSCSDDWFITMNPDVVITVDYFSRLLSELSRTESDLLTISLFKDLKYFSYERSLRKFPKFIDLFNVFLGGQVTESYNNVELNDKDAIDWASGAFLIFRVPFYQRLNGFDTKYFMYYEDVDICYRSLNLYDTRVTYLKEVKGFHKGAYNNRKLLSKHFFWYVSSLFKFLWASK